jgi:NCAIR mutase (PurE)-related protein
LEQDKLLQLLNDVKNGGVTPQDALLELKMAPFEDIGYAKIDHHRSLRHGIPEVIYGAGKTAGQLAGIIDAMRNRGNSNILVTRLTPEKAEELCRLIDIEYDPVSRIAIYGKKFEARTKGFIGVVAAGTSDISVAEEAAVTAEALGNRVETPL